MARQSRLLVRKISLLASAMALAATAASAGLVATAAPAVAATSVVVSPNTDVSGGDLITIQADGFEPGEVAGWCQTSDIVPPTGTQDVCGNNTVHSRVVAADGSFSGQVHINRFIYIPAVDRWFDCADPAEGCGIGVAAVNRLAATAAFAPIDFAPVPAPPATRGTIVISPDTQVAGGPVTVTGSGFRPNELYYVFQCAAGAVDQADCGYAKVWYLRTDATGEFEVLTTVGATVDPLDAFGAPPTNCITSVPAERCVVAVAEAVDVPGTLVSTPVSIIPGVVTVTPSADLLAGPTQLSVAGSSFPAGDEVGLCSGVEPSGPLRWWELATTDVSQSRMGFCGTAREFDQTFEVATVGGDGTFSFDGFRLERYVYVNGDDRVVDCADPAESCFIHVFTTADVQETLTSVPLDIATPPPPPVVRGTITAQPSAGLLGDDLVTVDGGGFRADALVDLYRCEAGATERGLCERLQTSDGSPAAVVADGGGTLPTTVLRLPDDSAFSRFSDPAPYDCEVDACSITAAEAVDFTGTATEAPIAYVLPRVVPGLGTVTEGDGGAVVVEIPVTLSSPSSATVTADWVTLFGPGVQPPAVATPGVDFEALGGTVSFAPGETAAMIELTVFGDALDEPDEYIVTSFGNPTNADIGGFWGLGFGLILDDDPRPSVVPGLGTVTEGDGGAVVVEIPVTLSSPSSATVTADWVTLFGPGVQPPAVATPGVDFEALGGTVSFAPGETAAMIELTVFGDALDEPDEYIVTSFGNPTNADIGGFWGLGFGRIVNDD